MNVKQAIKFLQSLPPEMQSARLILQKDAEGNGFSPVEGMDADAVYLPDNKYSGQVFDTQWTADEACMTEKEHARMLKKPRCIVVFPIN